MRDLFIEFLSPRPLNTPEEGREVLTRWLDLLPTLAPERFGNWEPIRRPFELEAALASWYDPLLLARRKPSMEASVWMRVGPRRQHTLVKIYIDSATLTATVSSSALRRFVQEMTVQLRADFAFVHLLTEPDVAVGMKAGTVSVVDRRVPTHRLTVVTDTLRRFLPELYWATVFGPPYVRLFGRERLLAAPAHRVEELAGGAVYVQLSADPRDLRERYAEVDAARRRVKAHLDHNAFFDPALHPAVQDFSGRGDEDIDAKVEAWFGTHRYDTPEFAYEGTFDAPEPHYDAASGQLYLWSRGSEAEGESTEERP